ncbi:MAG TPA: hypothetical protein VII55_03840 [Candidatus Saccharimonadales bacterium]
MAKAKKSPDGKSIVDVAHPGQSPPAANSKSVIVSNRPLLKDPMMVNSSASEEPDQSDSSLAKVSNKSGVQPQTAPLLETEKTDEPDASKTEPSPEPAAPEPVTLPSPPPAEETAPAATTPDVSPADKKTETDQPPPEKPDKTDQTAPANPETAPAQSNEGKATTAPDNGQPKPVVPEVSEEAKRQAAIDKLAESKKYYLPINTVEKRRSRRFVALGVILSLLLALAWADIALDAGLITTNTSLPHTHYFDSQTAVPAPAAAPVATTKGFTGNIAKLTFRYPAAWKLDTGDSTAAKDDVLVGPPVNNSSTGKAIAVHFSTPAITGQSSVYIIKSIRYQKLAHKISGDLYLRDLVYQDQSTGKIFVISSLGAYNLNTAGQTLATVEQNFSGPNGQSSFDINAVAGSAGADFSSVQTAQQFIRSSQYQQARSVLLSTAVAKT